MSVSSARGRLLLAGSALPRSITELSQCEHSFSGEKHGRADVNCGARDLSIYRNRMRSESDAGKHRGNSNRVNYSVRKNTSDSL